MTRQPKPPADYEVGYGRPPQHSRFKPGQSGNRKGRPKGALNLASEISAVLAEKVSIVENGRKRQITKGQLMVRSNLNKAIKADARAFATVLTLLQRLNIGGAEAEGIGTPHSADDLAIIERAFAEWGVVDDGGGEPR